MKRLTGERVVADARKFVREEVTKHFGRRYPSWWGPVADLYAEVGFGAWNVNKPDGTTAFLYGFEAEALAPGMYRVLAEEAKFDPEAYDIATNIISSHVEADVLPPDDLRQLTAAILRGSAKSPPRPTNSPVRFWKRDTLLLFLTYSLQEHFGLKPTHRHVVSENEITKRTYLLPSASQIIAEEFNSARKSTRETTEPPLTKNTAAKVWGDKNIKRRLQEARAARSEAFHDMKRWFDEIDVP